MMKRTGFLLALLIVTGCATGPLQPQVAVPMPDQWHASSEPAVPADVPSWDALFDDPTLAALIDEGLESNRNLHAAAARLDRAAAQARIVGADLYPQAAIALDAGRRRQNFIGLPIPGAGDSVLSNTSTGLGAGLNVSWEADVWGRLRAARDGARSDAAASAFDYEAARLSLSAQIAKTWIAAIEARQQLELAERTQQTRVNTQDRIDRRYQAGLIPAVELRLARTNAAIAGSAVERRRRHYDSVLRQLELLLGRYPAAEIETAATLPEVAATVPAGIPAQVLARRPDLRSAEARAAAAGYRVRQAHASLYPQFRLTGSTGTSTDELKNLLDGDYSVWSFLFNVVQPIFQGGRLRAGVSLAEATEDEVLAVFAQRALEAFAEVESALFAQKVLERQESALATAVESARAAAATSEERYVAGLGDYLLVLESERQSFEAESQLLDTRRQRLTALVDLYLALGGDSDPPTDTRTADVAANDGSAKEMR